MGSSERRMRHILFVLIFGFAVCFQPEIDEEHPKSKRVLTGSVRYMNDILSLSDFQIRLLFPALASANKLNDDRLSNMNFWYSMFSSAGQPIKTDGFKRQALPMNKKNLAGNSNDYLIPRLFN